MSLHREYKGFEINAHAHKSGHEWIPVVVLTRRNPVGTAQIKLDPPCGKGLPSKDEALRRAMEYGLAAVDGGIKGFDPNSMR